MINISTRLDAAVRAVAPIHGVSIGKEDDRSTWQIDFKDEATPAQKNAARTVLQAFDATPPPDSELDLADLNGALAAKGSIVRALTLVMFEEVNKLRKLSGQPEYSLMQFKTALKNKMR